MLLIIFRHYSKILTQFKTETLTNFLKILDSAKKILLLRHE